MATPATTLSTSSAAPSPGSRRAAVYRAGLAWFGAAAFVWIFFIIYKGAFTTSIGAGMVFPDWPLSNGSLNPAGCRTRT